MNSFFKKRFIYYLFLYLIYFWLLRVLAAAWGIFVEACGTHRCGARALCCGVRASLPSCGVQASGHASSVVVACGLSCPAAFGILVPWPGIEPASPALQGGFFTTGWPGKSRRVYYSYWLLDWLKYSWFTVFQVYSKVIQLYTHTHIYTHIYSFSDSFLL